MISKAAIPAFHALLVRTLREAHFDPHLHYHPEYQLFVVTEGTGTRFVGDRVQRFGPGDLVLTGPNLPHVWRSDDAYFERGSSLRTQGTVVYFRDVVLRDELLDTQEGLKIRQLLERSVSGLAFHSSTGERVAERIRAMERSTGFESILALLGILHDLSLSEEYEVLSRFRFQSPAQPRDRERMERVYAYLMGHFTSPIRLGRGGAVGGDDGDGVLPVLPGADEPVVVAVRGGAAGRLCVQVAGGGAARDCGGGVGVRVSHAVQLQSAVQGDRWVDADGVSAEVWGGAGGGLGRGPPNHVRRRCTSSRDGDTSETEG